MRSGVRVKESADTFPSLTAVDYKALMASKKSGAHLQPCPRYSRNLSESAQHHPLLKTAWTWKCDLYKIGHKYCCLCPSLGTVRVTWGTFQKVKVKKHSSKCLIRDIRKVLSIRLSGRSRSGSGLLSRGCIQE